jgi:hypothetical protein
MAGKANLKLIGSNYLGDLAAGIREDHDAVEQSKGAGLKHAIAAGKKLIEAKKKVKEERGSWIEWVEQNCKFTRRLASMYMRVAKMGNAVSHLSFREAIKQTTKKHRTKSEPRPKQQVEDWCRRFADELSNAIDDLQSKSEKLELIEYLRGLLNNWAEENDRL